MPAVDPMEQGYLAGITGLDRSSCPYPLVTYDPTLERDDWEDWQTGFFEGMWDRFRHRLTIPVYESDNSRQKC